MEIKLSSKWAVEEREMREIRINHSNAGPNQSCGRCCLPLEGRCAAVCSAANVNAVQRGLRIPHG